MKEFKGKDICRDMRYTSVWNNYNYTPTILTIRIRKRLSGRNYMIIDFGKSKYHPFSGLSIEPVSRMSYNLTKDIKRQNTLYQKARKVKKNKDIWCLRSSTFQLSDISIIHRLIK